MEVCIPLKDHLAWEPHIPRMTKFKIGPFLIHFVMMDWSKLPSSRKMIISTEEKKLELPDKYYPKKYCITFNIDDKYFWFMDPFDDLNEAMNKFSYYVNQIKNGKMLEFKDRTKRQAPITVQYTGINWLI